MAGIQVFDVALPPLSKFFEGKNVVEHPSWRRTRESTSTMLANIKVWRQGKNKNSSSIRKKLVEDFVFNVNSNELEGSDNIDETRQVIAQHQEVRQRNPKHMESLRAEPPSLHDTITDKVKADVNLYDAYTLVEKWCKEDAARDGIPCIKISRIKQLHFVLFHNREFWKEAGKFRSQPVYVNLTSGHYLEMAPYDLITRAITKLVGAVNTLLEDIYAPIGGHVEIEKLFKLVAAFYLEFEIIHPFIDGNGRTGRLLVAYLLRSVMPTGPNSFYMDHDDQTGVLSSRDVYHECFFPEHQPFAQDISLIEALLVEGVYATWKLCLQVKKSQSISSTKDYE